MATEPKKLASGEELLRVNVNAIIDELADVKKRLEYAEANKPAFGDVVTGTALHGWLGIIREKGPNNESSKTDARYWIERLEADGDQQRSAGDPYPLLKVRGAKEIWGKPTSDVDYVEATNLAECIRQLNTSSVQTFYSISHALPLGAIVRVFTVHSPGVFHYFERKPDWMVKIGAPLEGGGKYSGTLWLAPTGNVPPGNILTESHMGVAGGTVRVVNTREELQDTHDLQTEGFFPQIFPATFRRIANDGVPVFAIDGDQWEDCEDDGGEEDGGSP